MPALASTVWAGLVARPWIGERIPAAGWLVLGGALVCAGIALAPPRPSRFDVLGERGLLVPHGPEGAVAAVAPPRPEGADRAAILPILLALAGTFLLGIGWGSAHAHKIQGAFLARIAPAEVTVEGSLRTDPRADRDGWSAFVDVRIVRTDTGTTAVHESLWVDGRGSPPEALRGDRVQITGQVLVPEEGGFAEFLLRRGAAGEIRADEAERLGPSDLAPLRWAQSFRAIVGRSIRAIFPPREAGLLLGLAIGDDSMLDPAVERDFRATGLSHLLVVSGGNVAMILGPILALGVAIRLGRWPRFLVGLGTVAFFVLLTGAEPSVLRAGVMAGFGLLGMLLGRPRSAVSILCGAVFVLLVLDPALVWAVGFQLSVAATAGMVALATPIADRLRLLPRPVALAAGATLAAQLGVTPILLYYFHEVPLSTIAANVLAFPAVSPAMLLGLAAAGVWLVSEPVGELVAALAQIPMRYLEIVADRMARAPVPWITGGGISTLVVGTLLALGFAWWLRSGRRAPRAAIVLGLALAPFAVWSNALSAGPPSGLTVRFFDVGQGDAALLTSPGGASMLVDGGPDPAQVATELSALGVKRLDVVVASHPHADHIVGLPAVLARFPVGLLLEPGCPTESPDAAELAAAIAAENVPVRNPRAGDTLMVGDLRVDVLSPTDCFTGTESDTNNDALVLLVSIGEDTVLIATEPEEPAQQVLLDQGVRLSADVLKVPHHGAATSLEAFFQAVAPEVAVVSVGPNTYGHPVPEVLDWIRATGATVLRTDEVGDVVLTFDGRGVVVASAP